MICKACGRSGATGDRKRYFVRYLNILEPLCWACVYWVQSGHVMPEKRT